MRNHRELIESTLRSQGVLSAGELVKYLNVSQPTISRAIADISRQRLLTIGKSRSTRYGLRRQIRDLGSDWPVYNILPDGNIEYLGRLYALESRQWYFEQDTPWSTICGFEFRDGLYPGLPWFLHDLRPQGFLGRAFARHYAPRLGTSPDPRDWTHDDILGSLIQFGADLSGSFLIGNAMLAAVQQRMQAGPDAIEMQNRNLIYPVTADNIMQDGVPGSSAAGEQPKFTACIQDRNNKVRHVIVKFSGRTDRPENIRWSDLLIAEDIANRVLTSIGITCSETTVLQAEGRTFLESCRFDRIGSHGRRGLVSLEALDSAFFGHIDTPWTEASVRLLRDGWISALDAEQLVMLWWFGSFIGNSDMHYGNTSLLITRDRPLSLAPVYDMVPMQYRPNQEGYLPSEPIIPPLPVHETKSSWDKAAVAAIRYWSQLSESPLISRDFADIASRNSDILDRHLKRYK